MSTMDLRTTQRPPMGLHSDDLDIRGKQTTRFIWRRVCEHCCSSSLLEHDGSLRCGGCYRRANLAPLEDEQPSIGRD